MNDSKPPTPDSKADGSDPKEPSAWTKRLSFNVAHGLSDPPRPMPAPLSRFLVMPMQKRITLPNLELSNKEDTSYVSEKSSNPFQSTLTPSDALSDSGMINKETGERRNVRVTTQKGRTTVVAMEDQAGSNTTYKRRSTWNSSKTPKARRLRKKQTWQNNAPCDVDVVLFKGSDVPKGSTRPWELTHHELQNMQGLPVKYQHRGNGSTVGTIKNTTVDPVTGDVKARIQLASSTLTGRKVVSMLESERGKSLSHLHNSDSIMRKEVLTLENQLRDQAPRETHLSPGEKSMLDAESNEYHLIDDDDLPELEDTPELEHTPENEDTPESERPDNERPALTEMIQGSSEWLHNRAEHKRPEHLKKEDYSKWEYFESVPAKEAYRGGGFRISPDFGKDPQALVKCTESLTSHKDYMNGLMMEMEIKRILFRMQPPIVITTADSLPFLAPPPEFKEEPGYKDVLADIPPETRANLGRYLLPGGSSQKGFLGVNDVLETIIQKDTEFLQGVGITFEQVADALETLHQLGYRANKHLECKNTLLGFIEIRPPYGWMGSQCCPFGCKGVGGFADVTVRNTHTNEKFTFGSLLPHLIRCHHFFEGSTSYRVDPEQVVRVLGLSPKESYAAAKSNERVWSCSGSQSPATSIEGYEQSVVKKTVVYASTQVDEDKNELYTFSVWDAYDKDGTCERRARVVNYSDHDEHFMLEGMVMDVHSDTAVDSYVCWRTRYAPPLALGFSRTHLDSLYRLATALPTDEVRFVRNIVACDAKSYSTNYSSFPVPTSHEAIATAIALMIGDMVAQKQITVLTTTQSTATVLLEHLVKTLFQLYGVSEICAGLTGDDANGSIALRNADGSHTHVWMKAIDCFDPINVSAGDMVILHDVATMNEDVLDDTIKSIRKGENIMLFGIPQPKVKPLTNPKRISYPKHISKTKPTVVSGDSDGDTVPGVCQTGFLPIIRPIKFFRRGIRHFL